MPKHAKIFSRLDLIEWYSVMDCSTFIAVEPFRSVTGNCNFVPESSIMDLVSAATAHKRKYSCVNIMRIDGVRYFIPKVQLPLQMNLYGRHGLPFRWQNDCTMGENEGQMHRGT